MSFKYLNSFCKYQQILSGLFSCYFWKKEFMIVLLSSIAICSCRISRTITNDMEIEEISLYEYYREGGTTTVGALSDFNNLQAGNFRTVKIEGSELEMIRTIISTSKTVKYPKWYQSKTGIYLLFFEFKDTDSKTHRMYLVYDGAFVDIDNNVHYCIEDEGQRLWIRQFQEKYRGKSLDW